MKDVKNNIIKIEIEKIPKGINHDPSFRAASVYNAFSKDPDIGKIKENNKVETDSLQEFIKLMPTGGVILDIGCGMGFETNYFQECGFKAYGIDISENKIKIAKELFPKCNFSVENLSDPNIFERYKPDGVYECLALMYLPKDTIEKVFKNIYENLSEGGLFQLTIEEDDGDKTGWHTVPTSKSFMFQGKEVYAVDFIYLSYFKLEEIISMLKKPNFEIVKILKRKKDGIIRPARTILCRKHNY